MILRRIYPGREFFSCVCWALFAVGLVVLVVRGTEGPPAGATAWAVFALGMAVLGGTLRLEKTILEVGFHLQEQIQEARTRPPSGSSTT